MAIPDRRACFDYFRPVTRLSEWIQAFVEDRDRPSLAQNFDSREVFSHFDDGNQRTFAFLRNGSPEKVTADLGLDVVFGDWMERLRNKDENYYDAHCSVFTPSSFELLVRDAAYLGLAPFEVVEIFDAGSEFHVHLRVNLSVEDLRPASYEQTRQSLLRSIQDEARRPRRSIRKCDRRSKAWRLAKEWHFHIWTYAKRIEDFVSSRKRSVRCAVRTVSA